MRRDVDKTRKNGVDLKELEEHRSYVITVWVYVKALAGDATNTWMILIWNRDAKDRYVKVMSGIVRFWCEADQ